MLNFDWCADTINAKIEIRRSFYNEKNFCGCNYCSHVLRNGLRGKIFELPRLRHLHRQQREMQGESRQKTKIIKRINKGDEVQVVGQRTVGGELWYEVYTAPDSEDEEGPFWVSARYITPEH